MPQFKWSRLKICQMSNLGKINGKSSFLQFTFWSSVFWLVVTLDSGGLQLSFVAFFEVSSVVFRGSRLETQPFRLIFNWTRLMFFVHQSHQIRINVKKWQQLGQKNTLSRLTKLLSVLFVHLHAWLLKGFCVLCNWKNKSLLITNKFCQRWLKIIF